MRLGSKMESQTIVSICIGAATLFLLLRWLEEIHFFWRNKWEFSLRHGMNFSFGVEGETNNPVSNKTKILVAYPLMISIFAVLGILIYLSK